MFAALDAFPFSLDQWFSNLSNNQSHLEGLLRHIAGVQPHEVHIKTWDLALLKGPWATLKITIQQ